MTRRVVPLLFFLLAIGLVVGPSAWAAPVTPITAVHTCTKYEQVKPHVYIQTFDSTEVTGGIAGLPDRVETELQAGDRDRFCIGFHNRTGSAIHLSFDTEDVGATRDGVPTTAASNSDKYGAAAWIKLPTHDITIQHGELVWLDVAVDVPNDTSGGSNYAAVLAFASPATDTGTAVSPGTNTQLRQAIAVQMFFDIRGDITAGGELIDVRSPKLVWWDGLGGGDLPVLKKLRGLGIAPIRFAWKNSGSFTDKVSGDVAIKSSLGGKQVTKLEFPEQVVLRSSARDYEVTWSKDIPLLGRFTPTITVHTADGKTHTKQLDPIWVIPAWWYIALLIIAIAIPLWWRRRSRRRYDDLLARVEAAESRGAEDEWDEYDEP